MPMPSVEPVILSVLEPYLEEAQRAWAVAGGAAPTLPATDGKVNVRDLVRRLMRRDARILASHEQHFFDKPALRPAVNAVAAEQGLAPIGSRGSQERTRPSAGASARSRARPRGCGRPWPSGRR